MSLLSLLPLSPLPRHHDLGDGAVRRARRHGNPGKERGSGGRDRPTVRDDCDGGGGGGGGGGKGSSGGGGVVVGGGSVSVLVPAPASSSSSSFASSVLLLLGGKERVRDRGQGRGDARANLLRALPFLEGEEAAAAGKGGGGGARSCSCRAAAACAGAGDGEGSDAPRPRWDPPGAAAPLPRQGSGGLRVSSPELLAGEARRPPEGPLPEPLVQDDGGEGRRSRGGWFSLFRRRSRRCRRCLCCLCCRCCCPLPHRLGGLPSPQKVRGDDRAEEERRRESPPPSSFFSFFSAAAAAGSDKGFRKGPRLRPPRLVERRLGLEDE